MASADKETETEAGEAAEAPKGSRLKTLLLFVGAPVLVLVLAGGAAAFFLLGGEPETSAGEDGVPVAAAPKAPPVFYDLPEIIVNLNAPSSRPVYLKLAVSLELENKEAAAAIAEVVPRVLDQFQTYLRELRLEDISGSAGMFRLKEELLRRVSAAAAPVAVKDVLFRDMIVQ